MIQATIFLLSFCGGLLVYCGYRFVARSDVFSSLVLLSVPIFFLLVMRPLAFALLENFDGLYVPYRPGVEFYSVLAVVTNVIGYALLLLGYRCGVRAPTEATLPNSQPPRMRDLVAGTGVLAVGVVLWLMLMSRAGGLRTVLLSLADRSDLFVVEGSYWIFILAKTSISVGSVFVASVYFRAGKSIRGWTTIAAGTALVLAFGGRGAALTVLVGGMICRHYMYRRISGSVLAACAALIAPVLVLLGEVRAMLTGGPIPGAGQLEGIAANASAIALKLSYLFRAFDYNVLFLQKNWEDSLSFFGEYPLGFTALVPRELYPDKVAILGSRLADALYTSVDYGVTPSMTVGVTLYWGWVALPVAMPLIGYIAAGVWQYAASDPAPLRLTVYALCWPVVPWLVYDLPGFLLSVMPLAMVFGFMLTLSRLCAFVFPKSA